MSGVSNYTVRTGDTLSSIAARYHTTVAELAQSNGIRNPDKLTAGQQIRVPDNFETRPRAALPQDGDGARPTAPRGGSYTVRPGDTLSDIAKNLHTTVSALANANHLQNPNRISSGQQLSVPGASTGTGATGGTTPSRAPSTPAAATPAGGLGGLSRRYEAPGGPGTVSTGRGDHGGVSYGSYQFATNTGSAQAFVNSLRTSHPDYHAALAGHAPGTQEFSNAWRQLAARDPQGFDRAQHDYIQATHYDVGAANIRRATGMDLNTRSQALRDVAWSTSVQHGPGAADDIFKRALAGRDPSQVSDEQLIQDVYAERGRKNADGSLVYFSSSSRDVQQGVSNRYERESRDALAMLARERQGGPAAQAPARPQAPAPTQATGDSQGARRVNVPYYSQFEGGHGYTPSDTACFKAASAMARAAGARVTGPDQRIQLGTSEDRNGRLTVNPQRAAEGRNYIDGQLAAGRPVVVGVSHKDASYNADGLTDHFVTVTGRGTDANGRTYYTFNDPGTRQASRGADTHPNNRFYVDERTGGLYRPGAAATGGVTERHYDVAMVRRNG